MGLRKRRVRCDDPYSIPIRCGKDFARIINKVKAHYLLRGQKPPTTSRITEMIAKKMKEEVFLEDEWIRLK